jgi:hypothetical protein
MEVSATDPQQQEMVCAYLADVDFPPDARVLEVGCGTGAIGRLLAARPEVGVTPPRSCWPRAGSWPPGSRTCRSRRRTGASGRCRRPPSTWWWRTACCPMCRARSGVLAEAFRVLRPGGWLAVFDGDYATITLETGEADPLQASVTALRSAYITDAWVMRRLPAMVREVGFAEGRLRSHGFVQTCGRRLVLRPCRLRKPDRAETRPTLRRSGPTRWSGRRESNPHRELGKHGRAARCSAVTQVRGLRR